MEQLMAHDQPEQPPGFVLFKRRPVLRWRPPKEQQEIISLKKQQEDYPDFAADFAILKDDLMPAYRELSNKAARGQNQFHLEQLVLIIGGALVTILGAIQVTLLAVFHASTWPGVVEAMLAIILASVAQYTRVSNAQERYFVSRRQAEVLKGEYFLFLGRFPPYDDAQRQQHLRDRVDEVRYLKPTITSRGQAK